MRHAPSLDALDLVVEKDSAYTDLLKCGICFGLLCNPVQCRHGHLYCADCLAKVEKCPECRVPLTPESVARALFVEKALSALKIHCVYYMMEPGVPDKEEGCPAVLTLEEQKAHQEACDYRWVQCEFCRLKVRERKRSSHEQRCSHRLVECNDCGVSVKDAQLEEHERQCPERRVTCVHCRDEMARKDLQAHLSRDCPQVLVQCPFSGCAVAPMKRALIEEHYRKDAFFHLNAMQQLLQEQLALQNRVVAAKDQRIVALETQMHRERKSKMKNTAVWRVAKWPKLVKERRSFVRSKSFQGHPGFDFFLGMFPFGDSEDQKISVYLFMEKGAPENAVIEVEFSITLVNHQYEAATVSFYYENVRFPLVSGEGWGESGVIATKSITPTSGFISQDGDDAVEINLTFRVINLSFEL